MQPKLTTLQPFTIAGISVPASNSEPLPVLQRKIGGLWRQFFGQGLDCRIPHKLPDSPVYGVYSEYAPGNKDEYKASVGVAVSASTPAFDSIGIEGGRYLVFEVRGPIPQAVAEAWGKIWAHFAATQEWKRRFTADFELYRTTNTVEIYVAVE